MGGAVNTVPLEYIAVSVPFLFIIFSEEHYASGRFSKT